MTSCHVLLFLALFVFSANADGESFCFFLFSFFLFQYLPASSNFQLFQTSKTLVSIDCGASESYADENSITWRGDDDIFHNSFSEVVQSSNTVSHVMSTLRVFTSRKKEFLLYQSRQGSTSCSCPASTMEITTENYPLHLLICLLMATTGPKSLPHSINLCVSSKSCKPTSTDGSKSSPAPSSSSEKSNKLPIILGTTIPSSMISSAIVAFILHHRRKKAAITAITAG